MITQFLSFLALAQTLSSERVEPSPQPSEYASKVARSLIEAFAAGDYRAIADKAIAEANVVIDLPWGSSKDAVTVIPVGTDGSNLNGMTVRMNAKRLMVFADNRNGDYARAIMPYRLSASDREDHCGVASLILVVPDDRWASDNWRLAKVNLRARPASDCDAIGAPEA